MTVRELILKLSKVNQDKAVFIVDADTDWLLPNIQVHEWDEQVTIASDYENRHGYANETLRIDGHLMDCEAHNGD